MNYNYAYLVDYKPADLLLDKPLTAPVFSTCSV